MTDARVSVLCDIACHLGEGPSYDPATDTLYWFDIIEQRMLERRLADGRSRIHVLPEMASAVAFSDDGRQVLVTETGVRLRDPASGQLTTIAPIEADNALTRSNDARVHPSGSFWIGTMGKHAEHKAGAIYWFRAGEVRRLFPDVSIPNSICFSPDGAIAGAPSLYGVHRSAIRSAGAAPARRAPARNGCAASLADSSTFPTGRSAASRSSAKPGPMRAT